jgi:hypothetical protein
MGNYGDSPQQSYSHDNISMILEMTISGHFFFKKGRLMTAMDAFGCQWGYHRVWIVRLPIALVDFSRIDILFVVRYF